MYHLCTPWFTCFCLHLVVLLQWVVQGAVDVDIGANPSAEGGGDDEGVDDQAVKVVDIVDTFRLQVIFTSLMLSQHLEKLNVNS